MELDMQLNLFQEEELPPVDRSELTELVEVLYCDPPWDYDGRTFLNSVGNDTGAACDHYVTMKPKELCAMGDAVKSICAPKCICFMWTTGPQLDISIDVLRAWGFKYKTIAFVWDKVRTNPGYYTMSSSELVICGTRGGIPSPRGSRKERQMIRMSRTEHSSKPEKIRQRIERMFPVQVKLEMFSRAIVEGWYIWGNQCDSVCVPALDQHFRSMR